MSTLRDYVHVVRRQKWVILTAVVLVPAVALVISLREAAKYQATAQVLVSSQDLGAVLTGTQQQNSVNPTTDLQTQAELARVPTVAEIAVRTAHLSVSPQQLLSSTSASASTTSNILTFTATAHEPAMAERLATAYATAYVRYRFTSGTAPIDAAKSSLLKRIAATPDGTLKNTLIEKEQTLDELAALKTNDASVVRTADNATQTAPRTKRSIALGLLLGLFLGIGLAFLREALDTRVRSADTIGERLELPLLARLPEPPREFRTRNELVMFGDSSGPSAEAFRVLRTNVEFAALGKDVSTIMVTSAVEREGKSTTIANLAIALARSGQRVVLVDLDLRRPAVHNFFDLRANVGVTQVALGHVSLDDALVPVPIAPNSARVAVGSIVNGSAQVNILGSRNGNGSRSNARELSLGSLHVLPSGPIPPDPGEFVGTARLTEILEELRDRADVVLVDSPPLFHVGDGLVLSSKVDAAVLVTRMEVLRRPMLTELHRLLANMPLRLLGFVVTNAKHDEAYGDSYRSYYFSRSSERAENEMRWS